MRVNTQETNFEHIELYGKPALFLAVQIDRNSVPRGWFCYDCRGTEKAPHTLAYLEPFRVIKNFTGTVLSPAEISMSPRTNNRSLRGKLQFTGEILTLADFCERHGLPLEAEKSKYTLRPASPEEAGLFYALPPEKDQELGTVGHLRADFGRHGTDFWTTWWQRGPEELNDQAFKSEFDDLVNALRENGPLRSFQDMRRYCHDHGGEIVGGLCTQNYGYIIETDHHRYALRCNPQQGDYNVYLTAFDLRVQEMNMRQEQESNTMIQLGGM